MKKLASMATSLWAGLWAGMAFAEQHFAPVRVTATNGEAGVDQAMTWLAITAVAMIGALWAVHWSIFRRK